ncbi:MAG: alpha/beta hydrolase [Oceanococcaceae bacterium]
MKLLRAEDRLTLEPQGTADACVIWLHGLGADGGDFVPIVPELTLPKGRQIRFVFPHAPVRPVTINGGMAMRAWFDIYSLGSLDKQDGEGIADSAKRVEALIAEQTAKGIPAERIVLAGFSQGGAIVLHTGLRYPLALGGILALSTFLPLHQQVAEEKHAASAAVPILMCHGQYDPVLPMQLGAWSRDLLLEMGQKVNWKEYPMQHQVCPEEIADISSWLTERLG